MIEEVIVSIRKTFGTMQASTCSYKSLDVSLKHKSHVQGTVCYICIKISGTAKVTNSVFAKEFHKHDQSFYKFEKYFNESLRLFCIKPLHSAP